MVQDQRLPEVSYVSSILQDRDAEDGNPARRSNIPIGGWPLSSMLLRTMRGQMSASD